MTSQTFTHRESVPHAVAENLTGFDVLTQQLLFSRGITTREDANVFFAKEYETGLHDPFLLPDMEKAVARILSAIEKKERIGIFSDYDCDGIPGGVLLHDLFVMIGYENFCNYIPHRHEEGYGLSIEGIDHLKNDGVSLIITVDCGIQDVEKVTHANAIGVDVIVTDHHEPSATLPPALAVIDPKRTDNRYPFPELCGTGIAYKLACALLKKGNECGMFSVSPGQEKWLLDLVGIATVADMVPLRGENRILAHYGLSVLRKGRRLGLQHLFRVMKTSIQTVSEDDIGFMIAPRINAASRMGNPRDAFLLLATRSEADAGTYARHVDGINTERKGVVAAMVKEVKRKLALRSHIDAVLVIGDPLWRPSLVGLVANTLAEEYQRPVFVWGRDGRNILKGSCRSGGAMSVFTLMQEAAHLFVEYGGHHASGGFAVKEECIHTLSDALNAAQSTLSSQSILKESEVSQGLFIDSTLTLAEVAPALVRTLSNFAPFGQGNPKPIFLFQGVVPTRVEIFGKQKAHTKIIFQNGRRELVAIGFFMLPQEYGVTPTPGVPLDVVAHVEESFFMGRSEVRLRIVSLEPTRNPEGVPGGLT